MLTDTKPPTTLTREELYERVWTTSVVQLAKEFGISDVGLAKACNRHDIPRPSLGYWAKKAVGKAPPRPPLPVVIDPKLQKVTFQPTRRPPPPTAAEGGLSVPVGDLPAPPLSTTPLNDPEIASAFERFQRADLDLRVPDKLRNPLPLVSATVDGLRRGMAGRISHWRLTERHLVWPLRGGRDRNEACLDVQVGRESIGRAGRFLNTLLRTLATCGFGTDEVRDQYNREALVLVVFNHRFQVKLREHTKRQPHTPTAEELADQARVPGLSSIPKWDYLPTGELSFSLHNDSGSVIHQTWTDGKLRRIEEMLPEIIRGFFEAADAAHARWKQEHEERLRRMEEAQKRYEEEQRRKEEQVRVDDLVREIERWELSRRIRRYARSVERVVLARRGRIDKGSELDRWLDWAHSVADRSDPLAPEPAPPPSQ